MAVEIPVVIDIEAAFDDAARRVDTAIKPLKQSIEKSTSGLMLNVAYGSEEKDLRTLNSILRNIKEEVGGINFATEHLHGALADAKQRLDELNTAAMKGKTLSLLERERAASLREAIVLLEAEIDLRGTASRAASDAARKQIEVSHAISQGNAALETEAKTIAELNAKISALRGKLQNLNPASSKTEWNETAKAIQKATGELAKLQQKLKETTKPGSIDRIRAEMSALDKQWSAMSKRQKFDPDGNLTASAQKIVEKYRQLTQESEKYGQSLAKVAGKVKPGVEATTAALKTQSGVLRNLASYASMYVSVFGLIRFAKQIRDVTGELEYQRVALGHLIQDEEYGARLFEKIKEAALQSPFQIKQLVTYTKQLAAYRIEQENLFDTTKRLADISAGLGVDMNRLILAFGQVRAASVLRGQELRQFTEAGIPLVELLADKMGELHNTTYRTADVFKLISERAVPFSAISDIFEDLTEKGGMFYKMQEQQAKTLKGRWEKLKDAFSVGLQAAGETQTFIWQNNLLLNTLTLLAKNVRFVPKLIEAMGLAWIAYTIATMKSRAATRAARIEQVKLTAEDAKTIAALKLKENAEKRLTRAMIMHRAATNGVSRAWWKLNAAMIANPIGAIIAGVTALISLFTLWRKKTDEQADSFRDLTEAIENVSRSEKQYERMNKQIRAYEKLANNTERTAKENVQLANTLSVLREAFPGVKLEIDSTNEKLKATVDTLDDLNKKAREKGLQDAFRARIAAQADAREYEQNISSLTLSQNAAWNTYEAYAKSKGKESKEAKKALEEYKKIGDQIDDNNKKYIQTLKYIEALTKYIEGGDQNKGLAVWQKIMKEMKDFTVDGKSYNLIAEGDIEGADSLYKALKNIDKIYQDTTESVKEMKSALSSVKEEYRATAEEELRVEEARRDAAKAILDRFGYISKIDKKKDTSALSILKEELKNVQEIYKRYKEFLKYMSQGDAEKKIKEIYSGVTAIDFLSPETYKKRLSDLLAELRKMQGRVRSGSRKLTVEMLDDFKKMIKEREGFKSEAYKLPGESSYTIGHGFYRQLMDGTKVVAGMKMTLEEADAELDKQIAYRTKLLDKYLSMYGKGIQLTDRQYNVLLDLIYQGPGALVDALKEADGDIDKLATALEHAASTHLESKDQTIIDSVKKRDMSRSLLFKLAGEIGDEEAKEIASSIMNLERIVQDVDWDEIKEAIENRLKVLSDEIKQSEAARDFFKNIFEATGDQDLAQNLTMSIYGNLGSDLEKKLKDQLSEVFVLDDKKLKEAEISVAQANADVAEAIIKNDYLLLGDYLKYVTDANKDNAKKLLDERIKNNAEWYKNFVKTYSKARDYQERIDTLNKQREKEKTEARKRNVDESGISAIDTYYDREIAKVELESIKNTYEWTTAFKDLDRVSSDTLRNLIKLLDEYIEKQKGSATPEDLKAVMQAREQAQEQLVSRNAYKETAKALGSYAKAKKAANQLEKDGKKNTEEYRKAQDKARDSLKDARDGINAISDSFNTLSSIVSSVSDILNLDELSDGEAVFEGIATGLSLVGTALVFINAMLTILESNPIVAAISAIVAVIAAVYKVVSNITANKKEREIKKQQELIDQLEESYERLAKAMEKSFGSDYIYNYNQQLEVLAAKQKAYEEQARLEEEKGKKADEDKIKDYQDAAKKAEEQIADMKGQLAEFFSGTDLTSAAEDFATAWIEAYKEFGSVTDAMGEKFQDMVESMINKSLAAKIMQEMLEPVFTQIDTMAKDGLLSTQDIADIAALAQERIPMINEAMTGLMSSLASAGYDVRESTSGFKGISKDYATASEESILGLAAAVNTQNFYISHVPTISENVSAILAAMTGGENPMAPVATDENGDVIPSVQMMIWKNLPEMHDDLAAIKRMLSSVITGKTTNTNTAYIAVK